MPIRIDDPHADAIVEVVQRRRGSRSKTRTAIEMIKERAMAMGIDIAAITVDASPAIPSDPQSAQRDARAGAVHSSRPKGGRACRKSA